MGLAVAWIVWEFSFHLNANQLEVRNGLEMCIEPLGLVITRLFFGYSYILCMYLDYDLI